MTILCLAAFVAQSALPAAPPTRSETLAIEHVTVLPMDRDTALADHTVLVSGDRIVWIGRSAEARVPLDARRIDGRTRYLIPGLVDMHVHLTSRDQLAQFVVAGVTTVRNLHGGPQHVAWRDSVADGTLAGPTIYTSGPPVGQGRLFRDPRFVGLRTPAEADSLVRQQVRAGYDMIKVIQRISEPVYQRLLEAARVAGMPVVGHLVPGIGLERSLAAGQVSIEHVDGIRRRSRLGSLFGDDQARLAKDAEGIARSGAWVGTVASSRSGGCDPPPAQIRNAVTALRSANVKLLAGTDAGIGPVSSGASLHCELTTLVAAGLSPYEALATATTNAGAFAGQVLRRKPVPFGTVTAGSRADLVLLAADPRADIGALARPVGVVLRGDWRPR